MLQGEVRFGKQQREGDPAVLSWLNEEGGGIKLRYAVKDALAYDVDARKARKRWQRKRM